MQPTAGRRTALLSFMKNTSIDPGWKWSEHVGWSVGATRCNVEHVELVLSGTEVAAFDDGRVAQLFRRTRIDVCFYIAPLFVNYAAQLPLHRFESVMDNLVERLVRPVVLLFFIGHEFVTARNGHIDATTVRISFLVCVIALLDRYITSVNVV